MTKAIILVVEGDSERAELVARLIASTLAMNGYDAGTPAVIDWPYVAEHLRAVIGHKEAHDGR